MPGTLKTDLNLRMETIVLSAGVGQDIEEHIDLSRLDREQFGWWIAALREAEADIRHLRRRLEDERDATSRRCLVCDIAVTGRADRVYCSATCRQRARRRRP